MMRSNPDIVGSYVKDGKREFYSCMRTELDRSGMRISMVLATYNFTPQRFVLVISSTPEVVQFAPFEFAMQLCGLYGINADDSPFDAGRVESISRQFDPAGMMGVSGKTLEGLKMMGHDPATVFAGRTIWARPEAYDAVAAMPGVDARRILLLGPAMAIECAHGGLHVDGREWALDEKGGSLHLSSRHFRYEPVSGLDTGIAGKVSGTPCACGVPDLLVSPG